MENFKLLLAVGTPTKRHCLQVSKTNIPHLYIDIAGDSIPAGVPSQAGVVLYKIDNQNRILTYVIETLGGY